MARPEAVGQPPAASGFSGGPHARKATRRARRPTRGHQEAQDSRREDFRLDPRQNPQHRPTASPFTTNATPSRKDEAKTPRRPGIQPPFCYTKATHFFLETMNRVFVVTKRPCYNGTLLTNTRAGVSPLVNMGCASGQDDG